MIKKEFDIEKIDRYFEVSEQVAKSHFGVKDEGVWVVSFCTPTWTSVASSRVFAKEEDAKTYIKEHLFGKIRSLLDPFSVNVDYQNVL